jgi:hypothetical protein
MSFGWYSVWPGKWECSSKKLISTNRDHTQPLLRHYYLESYLPHSKGHAHNRPQGPKGVLGRLRPWIFLTFGTTWVVHRQPQAPAAFTPRRNPWYSFLEAELTPGHMVPSVATEKIPSVTPPGIAPKPRRLVTQVLNYYPTPGTPPPHSKAINFVVMCEQCVA